MVNRQHQLSTIIIKTTYACDLDCLYCYEGNEPYKKRISLETVENTIRKVVNHNSSDKPITFIWHGGEPLIMGIDFYKRVIEMQKSLSPNRFNNSIQTNASLLTDEFIEFFVKTNFRIGISLDGPPIIHNSQRLSRNGNDNFEVAWKAIQSIRNTYNIRIPVIAVFTRKTLHHLDEFYEFFRDHELDVQIGYLLLAGSAKNPQARDLVVSPREYGQAMVHLFDRWINESEYKFSIQPFSHILRSFVSGIHKSCMFAGRCYLDYLNIDPRGNIVPCGRWDKNQFCYGNININNISDVFEAHDYLRYKGERSNVINSCSKCPHYNICHGGCAFSGYMRRENLADPDYYCESHKMLFDHMKKVVSENLVVTSS